MSRPTNKRRGCSRRAFLAGLGAAAAAPLVPILEAEADGAAPPQRLILLCSANGTIHDQWKPGFDGTTLTLGPVLAPLESHKQDLLVLDGLGWHYEDGPGVDHMR
ncbi:MAG TPA: DUF1552 domain-containing protein, partial [Polyangiaceae bacterium]|nr:DUF1552 domain-containing protein [Polyangiaceae bacterium]